MKQLEFSYIACIQNAKGCKKKNTLENMLTVYLKNLHTNVYSRLICDTTRKSTETIKMSLNSCTSIQQGTAVLVAELVSHV